MKKTVPKRAVLIPDNAKLAFQGDYWQIYQWQQKMYDGSTKIFEMPKRVDTVIVLGVKDGKLVMVKEEQPHFAARVNFAGGRVDPHEKSWITAAQREMEEETGLTFKNWRLVNVDQPLYNIEWFVAWYLATGLIDEKPQQIEAEGEKIEVVYKDFDEVKKLVFSDKDSTLNYGITLFNRFKSLKDLLAAKEFQGKTVDR